MLQLIDYLRLNLQARKDSERGATAVEYGLLVAVIALLIIAAMFVLSGAISDIFNDAGTELNNPDGAR